MKKPYIKKFTEIVGFLVWIVDGRYIRENINEEFTNYGGHYHFKFIPKKEFWIDRECVPGEEKYFVDSMLIMDSLVSSGISRINATKKANANEIKERKKDSFLKKLKKKESKQNEIAKVHKILLKKYSGKVQVWIVRGRLVRDLFFVDFTEGGHDKVYPFIPENEIWIDDDLDVGERKLVLLHEAHERYLMSKGIKYSPAHYSSSEVEYYCRRHPKALDKKLKQELIKNNK